MLNPPSPDVPSPGPSRLLALPEEIRHRIYHFCLHQPLHTYAAPSCAPPSELPQHPITSWRMIRHPSLETHPAITRPTLLPLLLTCRFIYAGLSTFITNLNASTPLGATYFLDLLLYHEASVTPTWMCVSVPRQWLKTVVVDMRIRGNIGKFRQITAWESVWSWSAAPGLKPPFGDGESPGLYAWALLNLVDMFCGGGPVDFRRWREKWVDDSANRRGRFVLENLIVNMTLERHHMRGSYWPDDQWRGPAIHSFFRGWMSNMITYHKSYGKLFCESVRHVTFKSKNGKETWDVRALVEESLRVEEQRRQEGSAEQARPQGPQAT